MTSLQVQKIVQLWRTLRQPFTLPASSLGFHECRWERLDLDVLACVLCGAVHACADGRCTSLEEVEDGVVCTLTGVLIRDKRFVASEFMSHVSLTDFVPSHNVFEEENAACDVNSVVRSVLCSETAKLVYLRRIVLYMSRSRPKLRNSANLALACAEVMGDCLHALKLTPFDAARRIALAKRVSTAILKVMNALVHNFGMPLKDGELQSVAVGLLYLMRTGVVFEDIAVLPAVSELGAYLPSENTLTRFFDIKSRTITESENRVKFSLRTATRERLLLAGFSVEASVDIKK
jgi:hypothetical protein